MVFNSEFAIRRDKIRMCLLIVLLFSVLTALVCVSTGLLSADPTNSDDNVLELGEKVHVVADTSVQYTFTSDLEGYYMICLEDIERYPSSISISSESRYQHFDDFYSFPNFSFFANGNSLNTITISVYNNYQADFYITIVKPSIIDLTLDEVTQIDKEGRSMYRFTSPDDGRYIIAPMEAYTTLLSYNSNSIVKRNAEFLDVNPGKNNAIYVIVGNSKEYSLNYLMVQEYEYQGHYSNELDYKATADTNMRVLQLSVDNLHAGVYKYQCGEQNRSIILDSTGSIVKRMGTSSNNKGYMNLEKGEYTVVLISKDRTFDCHIGKVEIIDMQDGQSYVGTFDDYILYRYVAKEDGYIGCLMETEDPEHLYISYGNAGWSGLYYLKPLPVKKDDICYVWLINKSSLDYTITFGFNTSSQISVGESTSGHLLKNDFDVYEFTVDETGNYSISMNSRYVRCIIDYQFGYYVFDGYMGQDSKTIVSLSEGISYRLSIISEYYDQDYSFEINGTEYVLVEPDVLIKPEASDEKIYRYSNLDSGLYYIEAMSSSYTSFYYTVGGRTMQFGGTGIYAEVIEVSEGKSIDVYVPDIESNSMGLSFMLTKETEIRPMELSEPYSGTIGNKPISFSIPDGANGWFSLKHNISDNHYVIITKDNHIMERINKESSSNPVFLPGIGSVKMIVFGVPDSYYSVEISTPDYQVITESTPVLIDDQVSYIRFNPESDGLYVLYSQNSSSHKEAMMLKDQGATGYGIDFKNDGYDFQMIFSGMAGNDYNIMVNSYRGVAFNCCLNIKKVDLNILEENIVYQLSDNDCMVYTFNPSTSDKYLFSLRGNDGTLVIKSGDTHICAISGSDIVAVSSLSSGRDYTVIVYSHADEEQLIVTKLNPIDMGSSSSYLGVLGNSPKVLKYVPKTDVMKNVHVISDSQLKIQI